MTGLLLSLVVASTPITLEQVRSESRNNLAAIQAELVWLEQYEGVASARGNLLPQIAVQAAAQRSWYSPTPARTVNSGGLPIFIPEQNASASNVFSLGANLQQTIVNIGQWYFLKQAGQLERATKGLAQDQEEASELEAIRRFYALYTAQRSLQVLQETATKSKELWDRAIALYEAGKGAKGDALAAEVNYGTDHNNAIQQQITVANAQQDLASWLARQTTDELVAVEPKVFGEKPRSLPTFAEASATARKERAILRANVAQIEAAQSNVTVQQANLFPRLTGNFLWSRAANTFGTTFTDLGEFNTFSASLTLTWNLFDGLQTFALSRQAEEIKRGYEAAYHQNERDVSGQVNDALKGLTYQVEALDVLTSMRAAASKNLEYFQERFNAGASNTLEVRDAQVKLLSAELTLLQTRANLENAQAFLARAMGILSTSNGAKP